MWSFVGESWTAMSDDTDRLPMTGGRGESGGERAWTTQLTGQQTQQRTGRRTGERTGSRTSARLGQRRGRPPAQPAGVARASEPVTLHESTAIIAVPNEFTRSPARGPAPWTARGRAHRVLRPRDPDRGDREPRARGVRADRLRRDRQVDKSRKSICRQLTHGDRWTRCPRRRSRRPPSMLDGQRPSRARDPAQPEVHLRDLRHRLVQPVPPRGRGRGRRGARQGVQPAAGLRRLRAGQDPPAARDRPLRPQPLQRRQGALRVQRGVHQRVHQRDPRRPAGPVQAALPRRRRAAHRRHPVPGGQDPDPGGVLPHVQHPAQREQADRADLRPRRPSGSRRSRTGCATGSSGA